MTEYSFEPSLYRYAFIVDISFDPVYFNTNHIYNAFSYSFYTWTFNLIAITEGENLFLFLSWDRSIYIKGHFLLLGLNHKI